MSLDQTHEKSTISKKTNNTITDPKEDGVVHHVVEEDINVVIHTEQSAKINLDPTLSSPEVG